MFNASSLFLYSCQGFKESVQYQVSDNELYCQKCNKVYKTSKCIECNEFVCPQLHPIYENKTSIQCSHHLEKAPDKQSSYCVIS